MGTLAVILQILLLLVGLFMILIVLLQRGRGDGLAGAFGGLGGQSAFGTKAGDVFTRITVVVAAVWVLLAGVSGVAMRKSANSFAERLPSGAQEHGGIGSSGTTQDASSEDEVPLNLPPLSSDEPGSDPFTLPTGQSDAAPQNEAAPESTPSVQETSEPPAPSADSPPAETESQPALPAPSADPPAAEPNDSETKPESSDS